MAKSDSVKLTAACPPSEYSAQFLQGMVDRMAVSFHKYGAVADGYPDRVNAIESLELRLRTYLGDPDHPKPTDGNTEFLMDVANFAMIEFMHPRHPDAYFKSTDSDESPGRITTSGNVNKRDKNTRLISKPLEA